jgi:hypothetical protein
MLNARLDHCGAIIVPSTSWLAPSVRRLVFPAQQWAGAMNFARCNAYFDQAATVAALGVSSLN